MSHASQDITSLAFARAIAERLRSDPSLLRVATDNLDRWTRQNHDAPRLLACYAEWRELLTRSLDDILAVLCEESERGQRLRQNSPFAGVLTPTQVQEIRSRSRRDSHAA